MDRLRLVVGVDGSAAAREALRWASRLATVLGGEIVVAHALGPRDHGSGASGREAERRRAEIEDVVQFEWCAMLRGEGPSFRVVVQDGEPVDLLLALAAAEVDQAAAAPGTKGAGIEARPLVVLGNCGLRSAEIELGGTCLRVLTRGQAPTLVVPPRDRSAAHLPLRRILVGMDHNPAAEHALTLSAALAERFGSWVHVVQAADEGAVSRVEALRRRVSGLGLPVHVGVERGDPAEVIRAAAARIDADLVVVGSDRVGERALAAHPAVPPSVSRQVVRSAQRPTLVVPPPMVRVPWKAGVAGATPRTGRPGPSPMPGDRPRRTA